MNHRKQIRNLHKRFMEDGELAVSEITRIGDIKYRRRHHVVDRVVYGRFWRLKEYRARKKR